MKKLLDNKVYIIVTTVLLAIVAIVLSYSTIMDGIKKQSYDNLKKQLVLELKDEKPILECGVPFTYEEGSNIPTELKDLVISYPENAEIKMYGKIEKVGDVTITVLISKEDKYGQKVVNEQDIYVSVVDTNKVDIIIKEEVAKNEEEVISLISVVDPIFGELPFVDFNNGSIELNSWAVRDDIKTIDFSYNHETEIEIYVNDCGEITPHTITVKVGK